MTKIFIDHAGRLQLVEAKREEVTARLKYWSAVCAASVAAFLILCVAAGLI